MSLNKVNYVHGQTIISAQNMNDIQDEIIRLGEKEVVQSDWLEQDENSLAYVKNRPFSNSVGQYMTVCNIEEAITSDKLIEITVNDNLYYLYDVTPEILWFDIYGIGLYQKTAFEDINGNYVTLYDMKHGGYVEPLSNYDENLTGYVYYDNDAPTSLSEGIIVTETNTGSAKRINIYICFNDQKETWVKRVLLNSSYIFLMPGALSTIDMPLGVNYALAALEGIRTPLKPMIDSANESLNNLSKAYEDQEKSINLIKSDITSMGIRCSDLESIVLSNNATPARMIEIATNPYGVSLSTQNIIEEMQKVFNGENSDKIFIDTDESIMFIKMSDKVPTPEDISKGFTMIVSMLSGSSPLHSVFPPMSPLGYIHVGNIDIDSDGWQFVNDNLVITDGMMAFFEGAIIIVNDINNPFGIPEGVYTTMISGEDIAMLCSGLQISGFDLSSSTAPVSRAQIEDILLFIEESMITFTINGVSHRAIRGMTWGEWVNSRYNDTELTIVAHWQAGQIIGVSPSYVLRPYGYIRPTDLIQAEGYTLGQETAEPV